MQPQKVVRSKSRDEDHDELSQVNEHSDKCLTTLTFDSLDC